MAHFFKKKTFVSLSLKLSYILKQKIEPTLIPGTETALH